jgi:hypothetical protein
MPETRTSRSFGRSTVNNQGQPSGLPLRQWRITAAADRNACIAFFELTQRAGRIAPWT